MLLLMIPLILFPSVKIMIFLLPSMQVLILLLYLWLFLSFPFSSHSTDFSSELIFFLISFGPISLRCVLKKILLNMSGSFLMFFFGFSSE